MPDTARSRELKLRTIQELDQIADSHVQWMAGYHRSLLCGNPAAPDVLAPDAHHSSPFGVWYQQLDLADYQPWKNHLGHIESLHRLMHASAAELAQSASGNPIAPETYDRFSDYAYRFKTSVRALQMKLIKDVCLIDHLTGVWNRSSLVHRLSEECDRMRRHGGSCCLCMIDLDHFKIVNDRHGHAAGDRVLQQVAVTAQQRLRRFDLIFRYGGEEFLVCLPKTELTEAVASMERIRSDLADAVLVIDGGQEISLTASFGVAELRANDSIDACIEAADHALFVAKATGRNRVCSL